MVSDDPGYQYGSGVGDDELGRRGAGHGDGRGDADDFRPRGHPARVLGIPDGYRQGVLLPTAYYTGETFRPAPRDPLDTVLPIDRW